MEVKPLVRTRDPLQRGAALVTVILLSVLLGTACVAMLTAVAAGSRNNRDALGEYKAYYAAENGLQATVNFLRNDTSVSPETAKYTYAIGHPDLAALEVLRMPAGSNPSYVTPGQLEVLVGMCEELARPV